MSCNICYRDLTLSTNFPFVFERFPFTPCNNQKFSLSAISNIQLLWNPNDNIPFTIFLYYQDKCQKLFFTGPDGSRVTCTIEKLETGLYRAKYRPVIVGTHSVIVTQRKQPITKQPFTVQVFDPLQVKLTDLSEAFCHRSATFKGNLLIHLLSLYTGCPWTL